MRYICVALFGVLALLSTPASATTVSASQTTPTDLGLFQAGTYVISASGIIDIAAPVILGQFNLDPAGVPTSPITVVGYEGFNPNGGAFDPYAKLYGVGGPIANLGALLGSFVPNPLEIEYFLIGKSAVVTLNSAGHIYAQVNDISWAYGNNYGAFDVTVSVNEVPIPAAAVLFATVLAGGGLIACRRKRKAANLAA